MDTYSEDPAHSIDILHPVSDKKDDNQDAGKPRVKLEPA